MTNQIKSIAKIAVPILKKNNVVRAGIFGSYARGEAKKNSDIDILVKFKTPKSLMAVVGLELELKKRLKKKVDLISYNEISPYLKERILNEEIAII